MTDESSPSSVIAAKQRFNMKIQITHPESGIRYPVSDPVDILFVPAQAVTIGGEQEISVEISAEGFYAAASLASLGEAKKFVSDVKTVLTPA